LKNNQDNQVPPDLIYLQMFLNRPGASSEDATGRCDFIIRQHMPPMGTGVMQKKNPAKRRGV
jgi:hypothetical protein